MNQVEEYIIKHINEKKFKFPKEFNPTLDYSDEFYNSVISSFVKPKRKLLYCFFKRIFDIILSTIMLILLLPLFIIVSILIKLDSKGPVFFKQDRMGKGFIPFKCYKFRTMLPEAPKNVASNDLHNANAYVTKIGKVLRKTSIDELAQIINVFSGKMSFVGYRPIILTEKELNEMRKDLGVFTQKPGITGFSQINGRDNVTYKNKALMDAYYVQRASVFFDLSLIIKSFLAVLSKKGNRDNNRK